MSKAILIIDMPTSCWDCPCLDSEWGNCRVLGDDSSCMPSVYSRDRLQKCPLKPIPVRHGRGSGRYELMKEILGAEE